MQSPVPLSHKHFSILCLSPHFPTLCLPCYDPSPTYHALNIHLQCVCIAPQSSHNITSADALQVCISTHLLHFCPCITLHFPNYVSHACKNPLISHLFSVLRLIPNITTTSYIPYPCIVQPTLPPPIVLDCVQPLHCPHLCTTHQHYPNFLCFHYFKSLRDALTGPPPNPPSPLSSRRQRCAHLFTGSQTALHKLDFV